MSEPQKERKPVWKRVVKIIVIILIVLLLIALAVAGAVFSYIDSMMDKVNYVTGESSVSPEIATSIDMEEWVTIDPEGTKPVIDATDVVFPTEPAPPEEQGDHIINVMLVGQDARPGEPPQRSDSMILVTFNKITGQIMLTSFTRDQYVQIPGYGNTKLCHAYAYGGMNLLSQTLYNHYGVEVDGVVSVNFNGFAEIVDMMGGVDIYLSMREAEALNKWSIYEWDLKEGYNHLTGEQALRYSRMRHIDSDYQRTERQRKVIMALIEAYKDQPLADMMAILEKALPLISTNIPKDRIYRYAVGLFPMLTNAKVDSQRLPVTGTFQSGMVKVSEGYMAWCQYNIDFDANRKILEKLFDETP